MNKYSYSRMSIIHTSNILSKPSIIQTTAAYTSGMLVHLVVRLFFLRFFNFSFHTTNQDFLMSLQCKNSSNCFSLLDDIIQKDIKKSFSIMPLNAHISDCASQICAIQHRNSLVITDVNNQILALVTVQTQDSLR